MSDPKSTPIFLLHGLGAHSSTLIPIQLHLLATGFKNVYRIDYPVDALSLDGCLEYVGKEIEKITDKGNDIILIGQSMGGVVANSMHTKGWNIKYAIYIGSPLHGADLLNQLEEVVPTSVRDFFYKKSYDFLKSKDEDKEPPHNYTTISMGWFMSDFDGCVYRSEATLDPKKHIHLSWADHRTIFINPRLTKLVKDLITEHVVEQQSNE